MAEHIGLPPSSHYKYDLSLGNDDIPLKIG